MKLLALNLISKSFGTVKANQDISFHIDKGSIHALLGENGAGKSTLVKIIYGSLQPDSGKMTWLDNPYQPHSPVEARERGIAKVFQHFSLFESLTVMENIALGLERVKLDSELEERVRQCSSQYGLKIDPQQVVGNLSVGVRQRIEIIRCLMQNPKLLIMDEPTSVLTPYEVDILFNTLNQLVGEGCTILYISHKLDEVKKICSNATILRQGKVMGDCDPQQTDKSDLIEMMLGKKVERNFKRNKKFNQEIFQIRNLNEQAEMFGTDLHDISLTLTEGSITGIAGVAGNGQDELMNLLTGEKLSPPERIIFRGEDIGLLPPHRRREKAIFFTPEKRLDHATVAGMSLEENMLLSCSSKSEMVRQSVIRWEKVAELAQSVIDRFSVRTSSSKSPAKSLSGGNLQKFIIGREIVQNPCLLIINQPTWGVDAGSANYIHQTLMGMADQGAAILIISQDLDEILYLCDHFHILTRGRLSEPLDPDQVDLKEIGKLMLEEI